MYPLRPAIRNLLIANLVVFLLQQFVLHQLTPSFELWPLGTPLFHWWQLITHAFLHENVLHLFVNMFSLVMLGTVLERYLGARRVLILYFASVITAASTHLAFMAVAGSRDPAIGASGGVFGLLLACAVFFPRWRMAIFFLPTRIPVWLFVTLCGLLELVLGLTGLQANVGHFAHLGGMLGGAAVVVWWQVSRALQRRRELR